MAGRQDPGTGHIIDPTKVVRAALPGAASVAGLLITTEAMVRRGAEEAGPGDAGRRHGLHGLLSPRQTTIRPEEVRAKCPGFFATDNCESARQNIWLHVRLSQRPIHAAAHRIGMPVHPTGTAMLSLHMATPNL
jgi:hypothetical protein